jgi:hypothetical protein
MVSLATTALTIFLADSEWNKIAYWQACLNKRAFSTRPAEFFRETT